MSELDHAAKQIAAATCPEDVFGSVAADVPTAYHRIVLLVHPDRYQSDAKALAVASAATERLTLLKAEADRKIAAGLYGQRLASAPSTAPVIVQVRGRKHVLEGLIARGDVCDVYRCRYDAGSGKVEPAVFKIVQSAKDNDLAEAEQHSLSSLSTATNTSAPKFDAYFPSVLDSFMVRGTTMRRAIVLRPLDDRVSLADVLRAFPRGIDYRDMAWMYRRVLSAVGFAHNRGLVHGAVLPAHVRCKLDNHGATLIDWCYSLAAGQTVKAISPAYREWYAPEILGKRPVWPSTDIYMAAKIGLALVGGDVRTNAMPSAVPRLVQAFLCGCLLPAPARRPQDAWALHDEFGDLLERMVGKPKFRPFAMPKSNGGAAAR